MSQYYGMATPSVGLIQVRGVNQTGTQGIQVYITDKFKKVSIILAHNRFEAILDEVTVTVVAKAEHNGVTC